MKKPDISIIIVSHNAARFLPVTLDSIKEQKGVVTETVVVDNDSTDGTVNLISEQYPWVKLIKRDTNIGFSTANNIGVHASHAPFLLFFNPDIAFGNDQDLARCLAKYKSLSGVAFMTARVNLVATGGLDVTSHRGFPTPWASFTHFSGLERLFPRSRFFARYTMGYLDPESEHEVDATGGMFMLVSRAVGDKLGWWDEDYPLYGEDLDICYRARTLGYKNYYWPEVKVLHYKGATTGMNKQSRHVSSASRATTRRVKAWSITAMELFYRKHYESIYPRPVTWLVYLGTKLLKLWRTL